LPAHKPGFTGLKMGGLPEFSGTRVPFPNAALYPTQMCVYYLHDQWHKQNPGHQNLDSCWEILEQKIPA